MSDIEPGDPGRPAGSEELDAADAELLSLAGEFQAAWAIEKHAIGAEDAFVAAREQTALVAQLIATLPATTLAGLRIKAAVAVWFQADDHIPESVHALEWPLHNDIIEGVLALT
jgi:hypothetical protein